MPRRNRTPRRKQRRRYESQEAVPRSARASSPPMALDKMVLPKGKCFYRSKGGKLTFATEADAREALKQAQRKRRPANGHVECRYYECPEGGCGGFHLTSRESFEDRSKAS